jgi:Anti-sigma-K factor rskA
MAQQQASDVELRLSELQTQIDRLSLALHQWHQTPEDDRPTEERLSQLLERCTETLSRVTAIDERHSEVVAKLESRLSDWSFIEARLEQDSDQRIRQFEQIIGHEWEALRKLHAEPARELREQAANLGETCLAAANLALRGFERAEARIAALEAGLQGRMTELGRELQGAVAELRSGSPAHAALPLPGDLSPFPLDSVMRIHDELRRSDGSVDASSPRGEVTSAAGQSAAFPPRASLQLSEAAARFSDRMESLERAVTSGQEEARATARTEGMRRAWRAAILVAAIAVAGGSLLLFWLQRRVEARLNDAAVRVAAAERQAETATQLASQRIAETREEAERKLAEARETALQAQIMSSVLAAPDLTRINLAGGAGASRAYAQVLWSRSRGLVFSGSRLPAPRQGATYQLWLLTAAGPVNAGLFVPDSAGRATLTTDEPPNVPRPVLGASVTLEPSGGRQLPSGETVLTRAR